MSHRHQKKNINRPVRNFIYRNGLDIGQFFILLITISGLFFWARTESAADTRMMIGVVQAIDKEIKDFHGRLCAIEERNRDKK